MWPPAPTGRDPLELALVAAENSILRLHQAGSDVEAAQMAAGESVFWLVSADEELRRRRSSYEAERTSDGQGKILLGLRHVRNYVAHQPLVVVRNGGKPFFTSSWSPDVHGEPTGIFYISPGPIWPPAGDLPGPAQTKSTPAGAFRMDCKLEFDRSLALRPCVSTLSGALEWCWWALGLWEGPDAALDASSVSSSARPCPDCAGPVQRREYGGESSTPGRRTFRCSTATCPRYIAAT
ncbi:hypothetical protein MOPEL_075_00030 [Mobilicoccus pelagius NBRC 104925]|uniref:Uncharacterized protein n=1 Tax=Mobilicoccus pelagius NBRC 104925 TaxID=1089455 RepID=H5US99_9MICO|nr:hypothetical protein MOPEL_075_00030 [Mobilicoccus pelagius NBRC 104925]